MPLLKHLDRQGVDKHVNPLGRDTVHIDMADVLILGFYEICQIIFEIQYDASQMIQKLLMKTILQKNMMFFMVLTSALFASHHCNMKLTQNDKQQ